MLLQQFNNNINWLRRFRDYKISISCFLPIKCFSWKKNNHNIYKPHWRRNNHPLNILSNTSSSLKHYTAKILFSLFRLPISVSFSRRHKKGPPSLQSLTSRGHSRSHSCFSPSSLLHSSYCRSNFITALILHIKRCPLLNFNNMTHGASNHPHSRCSCLLYKRP